MPRSIPSIHKKDKPKPHPKPPIARPRPAARMPLPVAELFRFPPGTRVFCHYEENEWVIQLLVPDEPPREIKAVGIHWGIRQLGKAWNKDRKEKADGSADRPVA